MLRSSSNALVDRVVSEFQSNLSRYMEDCDINQHELARKLGITQSCISSLVRMNRPMTRVQMLAIKYVLGMEA